MYSDTLNFVNVPDNISPPDTYNKSMDGIGLAPTSREGQRFIGETASILHGGFPGEPSLLEELDIHSTNIVGCLFSFYTLKKTPIDNNFIVNILLYMCYCLSLFFSRNFKFELVYIITFIGVFLMYYLYKYMSRAFTSQGNAGIGDIFTTTAYSVVLISFSPVVSMFFPRKYRILICLPFILVSSYISTTYLHPLTKMEGGKELVFLPLAVYYAYLAILPIL